MSTVASRDLRNHTAAVLRRVAAGARVVITTNGTPVAELVPVRAARRAWIPKHELVELLARAQTDAGLRTDLQELAGDTTDDLGPVR